MPYSFRTRKEPRLNLRFENHDILDEFELAAHKQGMSLSQWIKSVMRDKLQIDKDDKAQTDLGLESILIIRKLAEEKESKDVVTNVRAHVKDYLAKLKSYASVRD